MALDEKGFLRPTYDDILQSRIVQAKELFGEDIDTSEHTALGKFIRLSVYDLAKAWESLELCYYARFPNTATGASLDRLCPFAGISRNPATYAEHTVAFTGEADFNIPVGFLVGSATGVQFYVVNGITLDENGAGSGVVACTEAGEIGNVPLGAITEIVNPDASVFSVKHTDITLLGEDLESDVDLRERFTLAISGSGSSSAESIRGQIMRITGVKNCIVVENAEAVEDADGRPPHSFECFVTAPENTDAEIAQAIFEKKPLGIKAYGSTTVAVTASNGKEVEISFSHTEEIQIHIKMSIAKDERFVEDGANLIKTALIEYIDNLGIGVDVVYTALFAKIHGIEGVRETKALTISSDGSTFGTSNISISAAQTAVVSAENITIEVSDYGDT